MVASVNEIDRAVQRYNDACRVLALHCYDYAKHIGTNKEEWFRLGVLRATEETRQIYLENCKLFGITPSTFATY